MPKCFHKIQDEFFLSDSSSNMGLLFTGGPQGFVSLRPGSSQAARERNLTEDRHNQHHETP